jgi:hypothetical protein
MKKKLIMLVVRLIRLLGKESQLIPELRWADHVMPGRLYNHFGRVVLARENKETLHYRYFCLEGDEYIEISRKEYDDLLDEGRASAIRIDVENSPCNRCACEQLDIPCYCKFEKGERTGWFELISNPHQFSNNVKF